MKKIILAFCFTFTLLNGAIAQKLFDKVSKGDYEYVKSYLEKEVKAEDLFSEQKGTSGDSAISYTFSIIEWSAVRNCQPCLKELVSKKKKLEEHFKMQEELDKCLAHAVRNSNTQMVDFLLKNKVDINHNCEACHGQTPIQVALNYNNYKLFFLLLKNGANPNVTNFREQNLIHTLFAAYEDNLTHSGIQGITATKSLDVAKIVLDTLLARKIDINAKSKEGIVPLMYAAHSNQPALYDYAKQRGATFNSKDQKAVITMLCNACTYKTEANPMATNNNMFGKICKEENIKITTDLVNTPSLEGDLLLVAASSSDNLKAFKEIMEVSKDVNIDDASKIRPIVWSVVYANPAIANTLLDAGAEVDKETIKQAKKAFKGNKDLIKKFETATKVE